MIPSERDALISSPNVSVPSSRAAAVVLPVVFLTQFAIQLPVTTTLDIVLKLVCQLYWDTNKGDGDDGYLRPYDFGDGEGGDRCRTPRVAQIFSTVVTLQFLASACGAFAMFGLVSHLSTRCGKRRVLLCLSTLLLISNALFLGSLLVPLQQRLPFILLWFAVYIMAGNVDVTVLVVDMHIVDVTPSDQRTSMLALSIGAALAGGIPAFALGGFITQSLNDPRPVYLLSTALACILVAYNLIAIPKGPPPSNINTNTPPPDTERTGSVGEVATRAIRSVYVSILQPLGLFLPRINPISGKRNWRLALCGGSLFMGQLGSGYALQVTIIYFTTTAGFKPDDNGYVLASAAASSAVSLTLLTPLLVKFLQPMYNRHFVSAKVTEGQTPSTSFDVCLAIFGWVVDLLVVAAMSYGETKEQVMLLLVVFGIGSCRTPAGRSIVVASVEPSRSGEALAAAQMICSVGNVLSTFILGSILSATMTTRPHVVFWTIAGMEASAAVLLLCVRDADCYSPITTSSRDPAECREPDFV